MPARIAAWLELEQTVNDRIVDPASARIDPASHTLPAAYRPDARPIWRQALVCIPAAESRAYGFPRAALRQALGVRIPADSVPLFVHPAAERLYRGEIARSGVARAELYATPTASYRSLLTWHHDRPAAPVIIKTSLDTVIARARRTLREHEIACAVVVSRVLDCVPRAHRQKLRFEWFAERAGLAVAGKRHGWLLRTLAPCLVATGPRTILVPAFSLISRRGDRPPLLIDQIRCSGKTPERFVAERLLLPYVNVLGYLLFQQGVSVEGHAQNVLYEVSQETHELTGRLVLRDFGDASVNIALRMARQRPLPAFRGGELPTEAPFSVLAAAADHFGDGRQPRRWRARQTVERHGLLGFLSPIHLALSAYFPRYEPARVDAVYLSLWQKTAASYLGVLPLIDARRHRIAVDEAIREFLRRADWSPRQRKQRAPLPESAQPLATGRRVRRRAGAVYGRVDGAWGALYLDDNEPTFFDPLY